MTPSVSAIIVTRGDIDYETASKPLLDVPEIDEVIVYANGNHVRVDRRDMFFMDAGEIDIGQEDHGQIGTPDLAVYGRYAAIKWARNQTVYVQDDDCLIDAGKLLRVADRYDTESMIVANMPESRWADYPDSCLVGWGAVFGRGLPRLAFEQFVAAECAGWPWGVSFTERFHRTCDVVFTTLTPHVKVDVGFQHLPWAELPYRMFKQTGHKPERDRMLDLARQVRDAR